MYAQSTPSRSSSHFRAPPDSRSMLMQRPSLNNWPVEHALRKYPSLVPHRAAKSALSEGASPLMYFSNFSIDGNAIPYGKYLSNDIYRTVFYREVSICDSSKIMDTESTMEVRRNRLRQLIDQKFGRSQAKMVAAIGINAGELSGLLRSKSFGEKKARHLEQQMGLPRGYFDQTESYQPTKKRLLAKAEFILAQGNEAQIQAVEAVIDSFIAQCDRRHATPDTATLHSLPTDRRITPWTREEWAPASRTPNKTKDKEGKN